MTGSIAAIKTLLKDVTLFAKHGSGTKLRTYQEQVACSIVESIINGRGDSFVVIFPRQSGKNELQAQIETYLLTLLQTLDAEIVKVSPTWKPQSQNAMRRLERVLNHNFITRGYWKKESGYIYKVGTARIFFLSASPTANVVGATASTLLECDEAQDVLTSKFDKEINPMAASTNATRVFWGTAWTSQTLLAREKRAALEAEKVDGRQRCFQLTADQVAKEVPAYGQFVEGEIAKLGRNHPFVRTQFFSEEIDAESGMFPPARIALMQGGHAPIIGPMPGRTYAFCIDVGGEELPDQKSLESQDSNRSGHELSARIGIGNERDSTVLTIFEVDQSTLTDPIIHAPTYLVRHRYAWLGASHTRLYTEIRAAIEMWQPRRVVVDATGVGEALASFLNKAYPGVVIPFKFSMGSKSLLGWQFLAVVESGRFKEYQPDNYETTQSHDELLRQLAATQMEILPGVGKFIKYSVPQGTRDLTTGELIHDDYVLSAMLCAVLDSEQWGIAESAVIEVDALAGMKEVY